MIYMYIYIYTYTHTPITPHLKPITPQQRMSQLPGWWLVGGMKSPRPGRNLRTAAVQKLQQQIEDDAHRLHIKNVCVYIYIYVCIYMYIYIYVYTYMYIIIYIYVYIYTWNNNVKYMLYICIMYIRMHVYDIIIQILHMWSIVITCTLYTYPKHF